MKKRICTSQKGCKNNRPQAVANFYVCQSISTGYSSFCKLCYSEYSRQRRATLKSKEPDKYKRILKGERKRAMDRYHRIKRTPEYRAMRAQRYADYRRLNPEKYKAKAIANNALQAGKLKRKTKCEECGKKTRLEKHHPDYSKPLEVVWLCKKCHTHETFHKNS